MGSCITQPKSKAKFPVLPEGKVTAFQMQRRPGSPTKSDQHFKHQFELSQQASQGKYKNVMPLDLVHFQEVNSDGQHQSSISLCIDDAMFVQIDKRWMSRARLLHNLPFKRHRQTLHIYNIKAMKAKPKKRITRQKNNLNRYQLKHLDDQWNESPYKFVLEQGRSLPDPSANENEEKDIEELRQMHETMDEISIPFAYRPEQMPFSHTDKMHVTTHLLKRTLSFSYRITGSAPVAGELSARSDSEGDKTKRVERNEPGSIIQEFQFLAQMKYTSSQQVRPVSPNYYVKRQTAQLNKINRGRPISATDKMKIQEQLKRPGSALSSVLELDRFQKLPLENQANLSHRQYTKLSTQNNLKEGGLGAGQIKVALASQSFDSEGDTVFRPPSPYDAYYP